MASEAMNIKTLNTVVLASPRKNVEQSTGRILRIRPEEREIHPIIVDIVDVHGMYQSMWKKRMTYYKKCQYKILGMPTGGASKGKKAHQPQETHEPHETHETQEPQEKGGCLITDD
jgi:hypothetical protein